MLLSNPALTSEQKAATVIIALGAEKASKIYKYLGEEDIEKLTYEVARLNYVTADQSDEVLEDFHRMCITQKVITDGGLEYAREVLEKAFGMQMANNLLERLQKSLKTKAFEFIRKANSKDLLTIIQHERPQTIALILSYARPDQSADVISELPAAKQIKVVECIAKMDSTTPETVRAVEAVLEKQFANMLSVDFTQFNGVEYITEVIKNMDRAHEKKVLDELGQKDEKLVDEIKKRMFLFEDIILLDNRYIQKILQEVDSHDLVYAIKGSTQEVSDTLFANMTQRLSETIRSDLEITVNVRTRDVHEAQSRIVGVIRQLEESGDIIISKGGGDEIIA